MISLRTLSLAASLILASACAFSCSARDKKGETTAKAADNTQSVSSTKSAAAPDEKRSISLYTHMGNRVNGEQRTDADGNQYIDEDYAILAHLAERFENETNIHVDLHVVKNEDDIREKLKTHDPSVDIYTSPNWTLEEWQLLAEPYFTLDEAVKEYGDYAYTMYNDGEYVYALMPAITYNNGVVYNEEVINQLGLDKFPDTQATFEKMCKKLREMNVDPIALHRKENWPLASIMEECAYVGGNSDVFKSMLKSNTPFNPSEPVGKTIKMYAKWKTKGFFEAEPYPNFGCAMDAVAKGDAAMMLFGAWVVPQIQGRVPIEKDESIIKFAPAPDYGAGRYITASAADSYAIAKGCDDKDAARQFIEYIANDAQYLADSGFIANKKGVEPIVPDLYRIIDSEIEAGKCKVLYVSPTDSNAIHNQELLEIAGIYENFDYIGRLFDSVEVSDDPDWTAYNEEVEALNALYKRTKDSRGFKWEN